MDMDFFGWNVTEDSHSIPGDNFRLGNINRSKLWVWMKRNTQPTNRESLRHGRLRRNNTISTKVTYINLTVCRRTSPIVACCSPCSECSMFTITTFFFLLVDSVIAREVFGHGLRASLLSNAKITKHLSNLSNFHHNLWGWVGRNVAPYVAA